MSDYIKEIYLEYIQNPNCLIIVVAPTNQDILTTEAGQIAKECDPEFERTLCVRTKADLCEDNFSNEINANPLNLKLGTFVV